MARREQIIEHGAVAGRWPPWFISVAEKLLEACPDQDEDTWRERLDELYARFCERIVNPPKRYASGTLRKVW